MKILVFAKQIPEVSEIKFDPETNRIIRDNVPLKINSFDRKAVEEAIRIKEKVGAEVTVASMGPPQAKDILNDCLKMGADRALLITDRRFAGSDTLATARILSALVNKLSPDLVLAGKYSLDGETAQVPPEISVFSGYSFKSSIEKIEVSEDARTMTVSHENESGTESMKIPLPAVLSVSEKINRARAYDPETPDRFGDIEEYDAGKLGIEFTGSEYSPTVVTGTRVLESSRSVKMLPMDGSVYERVLDIIESDRSKNQDAPELALKEVDDGADSILGVVFKEPVLGEEISSKTSELASANGLKSILFGNLEPGGRKFFGHQYYLYRTDRIEAFTDALHQFILEKRPKYVVFPSTVEGREAAGIIAARLEVGLTADCVDLEMKDSRLIQHKPAFGGGIIASIYSRTDPQMTTVRPGMFRIAEGVADPSVFEVEFSPKRSYELLEKNPVPQSYRPLGSSNMVIGVGRGLKKRNQMEKVLKLASLLDASVGATRPLVDMRFLPRQQQVGLTGYSISPGVYLALGISGMANHTVGIRYSGTVISVNTDADAMMFGFSDYGIIGDADQFIDGFIEFLEKRK